MLQVYSTFYMMLFDQLHNTQKMHIWGAEVGKEFQHSSVIRSNERNKQKCAQCNKKTNNHAIFELMQVLYFQTVANLE